MNVILLTLLFKWNSTLRTRNTKESAMLEGKGYVGKTCWASVACLYYVDYYY